MKQDTLYACLTRHPDHHELVHQYGDGDVSNIHTARAAFLNDIEWPANTKIKVAFMKKPFIFQGKQYSDTGYTKEKADWVQEVIEKNIVPLVNLSFEWDVDQQESDVRISFIKPLGSFSYLGTQSLSIPKNTITMNLGWTDHTIKDSDLPKLAGTGVNVIHEFGHLLGMIHEHSREDADLKWNKEYVYQVLGGPPNNWSRNQCDQQIFNQYKLSSFNGSKYDKNSVMHYVFPNKFFLNKPDLVEASKLSKLDTIWINKKYPGKDIPSGAISDEGGGIINFIKNVLNVIVAFLKKNISCIIIDILVIIVMYFGYMYQMKRKK